MNVCYWAFKCSAYNKWDKRLKTFVALTASGTAVASLSIWASHPVYWQIVAVSAAVVSVIHSTYFSSGALSKISGLVATWKELAIDYDLLWEKNDGDLSSAELWEQFEGTNAYSDDVDGRFQSDVDGHSGHVDKVGAQRRWDDNHARYLRD